MFSRKRKQNKTKHRALRLMVKHNLLVIFLLFTLGALVNRGVYCRDLNIEQCHVRVRYDLHPMFSLSFFFLVFLFWFLSAFCFLFCKKRHTHSQKNPTKHKIKSFSVVWYFITIGVMLICRGYYFLFFVKFLSILSDFFLFYFAQIRTIHTAHFNTHT